MVVGGVKWREWEEEIERRREVGEGEGEDEGEDEDWVEDEEGGEVEREEV